MAYYHRFQSVLIPTFLSAPSHTLTQMTGVLQIRQPLRKAWNGWALIFTEDEMIVTYASARGEL